MSLNVVPFKSLSTVSYSPSIVTVAASVAVCEIFSVVIVVWIALRVLGS